MLLRPATSPQSILPLRNCTIDGSQEYTGGFSRNGYDFLASIIQYFMLLQQDYQRSWQIYGGRIAVGYPTFQDWLCKTICFIG